MAIGATPLIPLYRVQPIPDARLQRFGVNNAQLFGKPMVEFTAAEAQPSQPAPARPAASRLQDLQDRNQNPALEPRAFLPDATAPATAPRSSNPAGLGTASGPGALVDLKA
ncbi:hypothetical protein GETHLI_15340 [Geothrix limicola]|uniref:Uncharacterized protein n=1 Tax=Geothrix limicola TaxID=2927978 RepID=A0ABQ5QEE6_9BACT|nr:hypothetical protein [Geothrix limicola]GLH73032.1 hypothetical protein GETHLI_15340 [Geothrix limicola]